MIRENDKTAMPANDNWQKAYAKLMRDASVGRLFRGIVHNLNGAVQAFSMQSELFAMMFQKADRLLSQIVHGEEADIEKATAELRDLLDKRAGLAEQMAEKVVFCQQILQGVMPLRTPFESMEGTTFSLFELVEKEMIFLSADPFFKHKVKKKMNIDQKILLPLSHAQEVRLSFQILLQNALDAVREQENPEIEINGQKDNEQILIRVRDNGCGVPDSIRQDLFLPFVSSKKEHAGLGLYNARKILEKIEGEIVFVPVERGTAFELRLLAGSLGAKSGQG